MSQTLSTFPSKMCVGYNLIILSKTTEVVNIKLRVFYSIINKMFVEFLKN